jgi:tetraacyldisaccharide 4'-kinase
VAFAGIGRPSKFFASVAALGATIVDQRAYGDHHAYTQSELARLKARAKAENALLVTTEKDFVRLTPAQREGVIPLPVHSAFDGRLEPLLDRLFPAGLPPKAS